MALAIDDLKDGDSIRFFNDLSDGLEADIVSISGQGIGKHGPYVSFFTERMEQKHRPDSHSHERHVFVSCITKLNQILTEVESPHKEVDRTTSGKVDLSTTGPIPTASAITALA